MHIIYHRCARGTNEPRIEAPSCLLVLDPRRRTHTHPHGAAWAGQHQPGSQLEFKRQRTPHGGCAD